MTACKSPRPSRSQFALSDPRPVNRSTVSSGPRATFSGEFCGQLAVVSRLPDPADREFSKLFGEDDEATDEDELNKAQQSGENGEHAHP